MTLVKVGEKSTVPTITNSAGWAKHPAEVMQLAKVPVLSGIVVGSFTPQPREGNLGGTAEYYAPDGTSLNSLGLPNAGLKQLLEWLPLMLKTTNDAGKALIVSVAGETAAEYERMVAALAGKCDGIELNLSCPNRLADGRLSRILCYEPTVFNETIVRMHNHGYLTGLALRVKLSPYTDPYAREYVASVLREYDVQAVVCTNTFPSIRIFEKGNPVLQVAGGRGGMGGTALHHIAVANAEHFVELLPNADIIGCGGIRDGESMRDFLRVGCEEVQIGTAFMAGEDAHIFEHVLLQYASG